MWDAVCPYVVGPLVRPPLPLDRLHIQAGLAHAPPMVALDNRKNQLMTVFTLCAAHLGMWTRDTFSGIPARLIRQRIGTATVPARARITRTVVTIASSKHDCSGWVHPCQHRVAVQRGIKRHLAGIPGNVL